ncbi:MAG: FGGY family carbohydrate kinase [Candidatus Omnitrophota bacterium]
MSNSAILLAIDIGATSVKTGAFSLDGKLLTSASAPNAPKPQPDAPPEWRIWDVEEIWNSICGCSKKVMSELGGAPEVRGVAVTGFGADGVPMSKEEKQLYPCISWHCGRTAAQAEKVSEILGRKAIYQTTGYHNYSINTLNRFLWLQENQPQVLEQAAYWLHVQDYIVYRLTGQFSTELTIASTMMCLDLPKRTWAEEMLAKVGIPAHFLSPLHDSGARVGEVTKAAAETSGIPAGTVVATGGHDTELAVIGSGIHSKETFLDINGTWEILMAVTDFCRPSDADFSHGLDWECHAAPGWWNCQALMIAGGVIEWVRNQFYRECSSYDVLIKEAAEAPLGANNVYLLPAFVRGMGPSQAYDPLGTILGINTQTDRRDIARALFEGLSYQTYQQIGAIEQSLGVKAESIRAAGGGQKNPFWMQMKADMCGRSLDVLQDVEATMLGAAILAGIGGGVYRDIADALSHISIPVDSVEPIAEAHERYVERFDKTASKIPQNLESVYRVIHSYRE